MNIRLKIFLLLLFLFVASTSSVWACGQNNTAKCGQEGVHENSCCTENGKTLDACEQNNSCSKCPNTKDHGGCHCPCSTTSCCHAGCVLAEFAIILPSCTSSSDETLRRAFYFAQHMPKEVYFVIWQPPQLAV